MKNIQSKALNPPCSCLRVCLLVVLWVSVNSYTLSLFQREKKGLLKLLSNKKKLRPSPPSSPTLEAEQAVAADMPQGAMAPELPVSNPAATPAGNHCRTGPTPAEAETPAPSASSSSSSSNTDAARRSGCQENSAPIAPPPRQPCSSLLSMQHDGRPIVCERYSNMDRNL